MQLSNVSKAIAGGIISALVGVFARYGFPVDPHVLDAAGIVITAIISYVLGHIYVYLAPKNTERKW